MPTKRLKRDFIYLILAILSVMTVGALLFSYLESWSLIDSFYFVTMTATTVGYGDLTPSTPVSKVVTMVYAISIVPFVLYTFTVVAKFQIDKVYTKLHHLERKQLEQEQEISKAEQKLLRQKNLLKQQEAELTEHNKELEIVEDIMEDALAK